MEDAITALQALELWDGAAAGLPGQRRFMALLRHVRDAMEQARDVLHLGHGPCEVFADNRFEQHAWSWSG